MTKKRENEFPTLTLLYVCDKNMTKVSDMELALGIGEDCIRNARMALASKTCHMNKDSYHVNFMELKDATDIQPLRLNNSIINKKKI